MSENKKEIEKRLCEIEKHYYKHGTLDNLSRAYKTFLRYNREAVNTIPYWRKRLKEMGWQKDLTIADSNLEYLRIKTHDLGRFPFESEISPKILRWIEKVMTLKQHHHYAVTLRRMGCKLYEKEYKSQKQRRIYRQRKGKEHPLIVKSQKIIESGKPHSKIVNLLIKRLC